MDSVAPDINDTVRFLVRYDVQQNQSTQVTVRLPSVQRDDNQLVFTNRQMLEIKVRSGSHGRRLPLLAAIMSWPLKVSVLQGPEAEFFEVESLIFPEEESDSVEFKEAAGAKMADSVFNKMQSCFPSCLSTDPNGEMHVWCGLNDKGIPVGVNGILSSDDARDIARRFRGLPYFPPLTGIAIAFRVLLLLVVVLLAAQQVAVPALAVPALAVLVLLAVPALAVLVLPVALCLRLLCLCCLLCCLLRCLMRLLRLLRLLCCNCHHQTARWNISNLQSCLRQ